MRYSQITESRLAFTAQEFDHAAATDEYGVVYVYGDHSGTLRIGYPPIGREFRYYLTIWPKDKRIDIRSSAAQGNKVVPKVQQMLVALQHGGIIDQSWRVEGGHGIGRYRPGTSQWETIPEPQSEHGLSHWADQKNRLTAISQDFIFYHGTSSRDWEKIERSGLHPLFIGGNKQHGGESRAKHQGNYKVLYLTGTIQKAHDYAKLRVSYWNRILKRYDREYDDNQATVIEVHIPDPLRLVSDDDPINEIARTVARKLFSAKSKEEQDRLMRELSQKKGFRVTDPSMGQMLWRETEEGFAEIMARIPKRAYRTWLASLKRRDQVGYRGIIPPTFLKRLV